MADQKSTGQNIDQIRDLIFGEQIQKYERQFKEIAQNSKKLHELIEEVRKQLSSELAKNQAEQQHTIDALKKDIQSEYRRAVKELERLQTDKIDRLQMANLLIDLGMRLKGENVLNSLSPEGEATADG